jgi:hypothetical protein
MIEFGTIFARSEGPIARSCSPSSILAPGVEVLRTSEREVQSTTRVHDWMSGRTQQYNSRVFNDLKLEAPPGFEPGVEVLQCGERVAQPA